MAVIFPNINHAKDKHRINNRDGWDKMILGVCKSLQHSLLWCLKTKLLKTSFFSLWKPLDISTVINVCTRQYNT